MLMTKSTSELRQWRKQTARSGTGEIMDKTRQLEESLMPIVRVALHKGVGISAVVTWVRQTYDRLSNGSNCASPDYYVPQITRLLCARLQK